MTTSPPDSKQFTIVGIGASAGALEALKPLLDDLADDRSLAYVIVRRLSPPSGTNEGLQSTNKERYSVNTGLEFNNNYEIKPLNTDYSNLLASITSGIVFLDRHLCIREFNPAIHDFFKLLPHDIGRPIADISNQLANQHELIADINNVLNNNNNIAVEREVATSQGRWVLERIMPFKNEEGLLDGVVISFTDISKTKGAELKVANLNYELETRTRELEEMSQTLARKTAERIKMLEELRKKDQLMIQQNRMAAMGQMLANIAHQWRQPLNTLGLIIQYIQRLSNSNKMSTAELDKDFASALGIIMSMSKTIDDFRDFLLPSTYKSRFKVEELIEKTVALVKDEFRAKKITLTISSAGEPHIDGFANEYGQAIINIMLNAKDAFIEQGTTNAQLSVRCMEEAGKSVVIITDNAGEMNEEIMDEIFDPYSITKERGKGAGLGLFIAKNIIESSMGGHLTVRNRNGGAEFRIEV